MMEKMDFLKHKKISIFLIAESRLSMISAVTVAYWKTSDIGNLVTPPDRGKRLPESVL